MCSRRLLIACAISVAICVVTVLLFPTAYGPFTTVNGPATALRAAHFADKVYGEIADSAITPALAPAVSLAAAVQPVGQFEHFPAPAASHESFFCLRC